MITSGIEGISVNWSNVDEANVSTALARAYVQLDRFDDAWRCIDEAMTAVETTKEGW